MGEVNIRDFSNKNIYLREEWFILTLAFLRALATDKTK
jgi:hypothetical protein